MKFLAAITPLLWRVIAFLCSIIIISGIAGPRIISGGILFRDGFAIYSDIGKAVIFSLIAFVLLVRHNKVHIRLQPWQPALISWAIGAILFFALAWVGVTGLLDNETTIPNLVFAHAGLLFSLVFAGISCFGLRNIVIIYKTYRREIVSSAVIGIVFYFFLIAVYALWQPLASLVLTGVMGLLHIVGVQATLVIPNTLLFDKFGITVAEFCSGIESIALFTGLYAVVGLLDWPRLNKRRYFIVFPFALALLFGLNIIRVFGLIMAGYYINPEIAFSLFHTYAGLVFFVLYSAVFWAISYNYLLTNTARRKP